MYSKATKLRKRLASQLSGKVLDCGSGEDLFGPHLRRPGVELISLDLDAEALRRTPGETVVASCADIPFPDETFDAVWSCAIIEHAREDTLPEMIRVTRAGGRVVVITPNRYSPFDCVKRLFGMGTWGESEGHVRLYSAAELREFGRVHGESWFVPLAGALFWRLPQVAHVLIVDIDVTRPLKDRMRRRFPEVFAKSVGAANILTNPMPEETPR